MTMSERLALPRLHSQQVHPRLLGTEIVSREPSFLRRREAELDGAVLDRPEILLRVTHDPVIVGSVSNSRVGHELPDFLRAAAGDCSLGSPFERLLARGHVDDPEPADG